MAEKEYIEREKAIEAFDDRTVERYYGDVDPESVIRVIERIPAADVRPVVRGKWTMHSDYPDRLICSECGTQFDVWHWEAKQMHFCPNCCADMRKVT